MTLLFNLVLSGYVAALFLAAINLFVKRQGLDWAVNALLTAANATQLVYIVWRWVEAGRPPFSNMFESLVLFAWATVLVYLVIRIRLRVPVLGAAVALMAAVSLAYASAFGSDIEPLVPALRSNWLTFHVFTCFLGYAGFAVSFIAAIAYLVIARPGRSLLAKPGPAEEEPGVPGRSLLAKPGVPGRSLLAKPGVPGRSLLAKPGALLEPVMTQTVAFGFIFLTLGVITGAVWANSAWGTYWSWDPKETWSLITWFVYAAFLHGRYNRGWTGRRAAWISIFGFLAVLFTYIGVNLLLSGLHSYA
ncbi:MAG: c-type cytochrome biogenesis protein CcsB [Lentisphaerae bacterium]|nr:c-type cytochrome biogenesis protein CcsB [Lentisphaerota bacterium]